MGQIAIVLVLLAAAIVLFALEKLSVDVVTLGLLVCLVVAKILTPAEAFAGFSSDIIILLASIFVISGALQQTGIMDVFSEVLHRATGQSVPRLSLLLMGSVGGLSAFMNNTTATAVFIAPAMRLAHRLKVSPSKLLMPVAFASILGGTCTLIGTSTNIAVSGYIAKAGLKPLGLFEFTPLGLLLLLIGIAYMMLIGRRLLPDHKEESLADGFATREYLTEIIVLPESHLVGQRILESDLSRMGFQILEILRGKERFLPATRTRLAPLDTLLVQGKVEDLMRVKETAGIEIRPEHKLGDLDAPSPEIKVVEALVTPGSSLAGRTLKEINFRQRFSLTALALYRRGQSLREKIGLIELKVGDLLLIQGMPETIESVRRDPDLWILEERSISPRRKRKGLYTTAFFATAILVGGLGWLPLPVAFLTAAALTLGTGCISSEEAYKFVDWRLLILIGGMTAFGTAMEKTHTAEFLAGGIVHLLQPFGERVILAGFTVLTLLLTQPMSNAAAALVVLPVAMQTAVSLHANPRTFAIGVMLSASLSLITPFEPSCVLVYNAGKYRILDFIKVGLGLSVLLLAVILVLLPMIWPLHPVAVAP